MLKGEKRREQILAAAEEMFYQNGYERTTVSDIITALGLSKGGFYHHFESKEALLQAICDRKAEDSYAAARRAVDDCPGSWADKFNAMFDQYGMWQSGSRVHPSAVFLSAAPKTGPARSPLPARVQPYLNCILLRMMSDIIPGAQSMFCRPMESAPRRAG